MEHDDAEDPPVQTGPVETIDPDGLRDWSLEQFRQLQHDIDEMAREISLREYRAMVHSWHSGALVPEMDPDLPLMRSRLATRRAALAALLAGSSLPEGIGDPGLEPEKEDPALAAVSELIEYAAERRLLPAGDPLIPDEEVEEEHERQLGERKPGAGPARGRRVRAR